MKLSSSRNNLIDLKEEQLRLDNKYKKLKIKKIKLEIAHMKGGGNISLDKKIEVTDSDESD